MSSSTQSRSSRKDYNRGHENSANSNATSTTSSGKRRYYEDDTNDEGHYTMYAKPQQQRETNSSTRGGGAGGARYDGSNIKNNYYQRGRSNASAAGGSGGGPRSHSNNSTAPNTPNLTYQQQPPLQQQGGGVGGGSLRPGGAYSAGRRPLLSHNSHGGTSMSGAASSGGQYYRDAHQQATSYGSNRGGHLNSGGGGGAAVVAVPTSSTTQRRFRSLSDGSWWYRNDPYSGNRRSASSEAGQRPTTSSSSTKSSTNYCRHYLQGQCNRGAMCRFTHLEQHSVVIRSSKTPQGLRARSSSPVPPQDHIISGSGGSGGFQDSDMIASLSNFQEEDPYYHENHHIMADHRSAGGGCCTTPNSSEPAYFSLITNHSHSSAFPFTAPPLTPSLESSPSNSFVHDPYGQYNQQQLFYGGHHNQENGYYGYCGSSPASSTTKNAAVVSFPAAPPSNIRVNQPYNNQNQHLYHLSEEVQDEPTTTTAASPTDVPPFIGDDVTMSSDGHEPTTHSDEGASMGLARNETDMYLDEYEALQPGQGQGQQPEHAPLESCVAAHHHHSQSRPLVDHRSYVYEVAQPPLVPAVQQPPVSSRDGGELPDSGVAVAADDDASVATDISLHPSPSLAPSCQPSLFSGFPPGWDDEMDGMFQLPPTSTYHHHQPQQQQQQQHAVVAGLPYASNARFVSGWAAAPEGSSTTWRRQEHYAAALSTTNSNGRFSGELASSSEQHSPQFGYRSSNSAHHLPPLTPEDELKLKTLW